MVRSIACEHEGLFRASLIQKVAADDRTVMLVQGT